MRQKIVLSTILICSVLAFAGNERGYGFLMLEEPISPRSISMGSTGTALGGDGFRYYNPAAPFFSAYPYVSIEFGQMPGGVNKGGFESALVFPEWFTALGFYSSSVDFETRDERGFGSAASSSTTIGSLGVGFIRERLAIGVSAQMVQDRIWILDTYNAYTLSAGIGYALFDGKLNLGAAGFHGIAKSNGFGDSTSVWHDGLVPRFARAGTAWTDTVKTFPFTIAADIVYRDENKTISVPVGAEVWVLPYIALRMGKRFGWESEILSLGLGLNIDKISFDAAFVPSVFVDDYELKWSMGLSYNLSGGKRKKDRASLPKISHEEFERQDETLQHQDMATPVPDETEDEQHQQQEEVDLDEREIINIDELLREEAAEMPASDEIEDEQYQSQEEVGLDEQESVIVDEVDNIDGEDLQEAEGEQHQPQEEVELNEEESVKESETTPPDPGAR
jgi:hypothetical protein